MALRSRCLGLGQLGLAAAILGACGYLPGFGPTLEIPGDVAHRMSVAEVEQAIRVAVADDVAAVGREIRPFRLMSVRLVAPFERVKPAVDEDAGSTMSFSTNTTTWVVRAEGTFRDCASTCATYWDAVLVVEDVRGLIVAREPAGPTTLDVRPAA
jgi:hypothetical protein